MLQKQHDSWTVRCVQGEAPQGSRERCSRKRISRFLMPQRRQKIRSLLSLGDQNTLLCLFSSLYGGCLGTRFNDLEVSVQRSKKIKRVAIERGCNWETQEKGKANHILERTETEKERIRMGIVQISSNWRWNCSKASVYIIFQQNKFSPKKKFFLACSFLINT